MWMKSSKNESWASHETIGHDTAASFDHAGDTRIKKAPSQTQAAAEPAGQTHNAATDTGTSGLPMIQHNKQRHAAAMLVHQLGSGIEALSDIPPNIALENYELLADCYADLGEFILRLSEIRIAKNDQLRTHQ